MVWQLVLTVPYTCLAFFTAAGQAVQGQSTNDDLSTTIVRPLFDETKVTATHGSKHQSNPELIINFPANIGEDHQKKRRKVEGIKGYRFHNTALGAIIEKVKTDGKIQKAENENQRLQLTDFNEKQQGNITTNEMATLEREGPITAMKTMEATNLVGDVLADINKQIADRAARRQQIKQEGYKKYEQIVFKKGRNIVPVRLFFETDPVLLTTGTNQNDSFITSAGSSNNSEDLGAEEKEAPEMDSFLAKNKSEDNSEKSINRTTSMKLEHVINTAFVDEDQVLLSDNAEFQPEDLNGSGMRPLTTESMEETHTKLLPEEEKDLFEHQIREIKPIEKHLMTTILTPPSLISVTSTTTPEIEKSLDMSASEGIANKNATLKDWPSTNGELMDNTIVNSTITVNSTSSSVNAESLQGESIVKLPESPPISITGVLPALLAMPHFSDLSAFSTLNTPLKIASDTQQSRTPDETLFDKKHSKTLRVVGVSLPRNRSRKRMRLGSTSSLGIVDSFSGNPLTGRMANSFNKFITRVLKPSIDSMYFSKKKVLSKSDSLKSNRFIHSKKSSRNIRPNNFNRGIPVIVHKVPPEQQNFKQIFKIEPLRKFSAQPRSNSHFVPNGPIVERKRSGTVNFKFVRIPQQQIPFTSSNQFSETVRRDPTRQNNDLEQQQGEAANDVQRSSIKSPRTSITHGNQKDEAQLGRIMTPPLIQLYRPNTVKQQNSFFPMLKQEDWDRVRSEFIKIKHRSKAIRRKQQKERLRSSAANVKTLMSDGSDRTPDKRNEVSASNDSEATRIDVVPSRHTID